MTAFRPAAPAVHSCNAKLAVLTSDGFVPQREFAQVAANGSYSETATAQLGAAHLQAVLVRMVKETENYRRCLGVVLSRIRAI